MHEHPPIKVEPLKDPPPQGVDPLLDTHSHVEDRDDASSDDDLTRDPLEMLAAQYVERVRSGEEPTIDEYTANHPELADEIRELFPTIAAMERLKTGRAQAPGRRASLGQDTPDQLGDYRLIQEIGRGGMGVVFEAEQVSLGRRVAVKVLPRQSLLDSKQLRRFQREAHTAARLHHTNIVPVFGVGEQSGFHYLVMQLIDGKGLDVVLAESKPDSPPLAPLHSDWLSVARIAHDAASALQYAHEQGVLHRDVKPANLLFDSQGVIWVADFGLAKSLEQPGASQTGELAGTLRYMAPERFKGQCDIRSDVYGLGLTLYELLTRRPAFDSTDQSKLIRQLTQSEPTRPRKVRPQIPRDLETIVLKAIHPEPAYRYATPGEMAGDLQRYIEDRPIHARRTSAVERLWRWARREPATAILSAAAALLLMTTAAVATIGYVQTDKALKSESQQRAKAEATLDISLQALDEVYKKFAPEPLALASSLVVEDADGQELEVPVQPVLSRETAALLEDILSFYDRFAERSGGNLQLRLHTAKANRRVGDIQQRLGQYKQAQAAYQRSLEKYAELQAEMADNTPEGGQLAVAMANIYCELGNVHRAQRTHEEAQKAFDRALERLQASDSLKQKTPDARYALARTHYFLGDRRASFRDGLRPWSPSFRGRGRPRGGRSGERRPPRLNPNESQRESPRRESSGRESSGRENSGSREDTAGRGNRSRREGRPSIQRRGGRNQPGRGRGRGSLGPGSRGGDWEKQRAEANDHLKQAIEILKGLIEEHSLIPDYQHLLARCYRGLAGNEFSPEMDRAIEILQTLTQKFPQSADYQYDLCKTLAIANSPWRYSKDDLIRAKDRLEQARQIAEGLSSMHPHVPAYTSMFVQVSHRLAEVVYRNSRYIEKSQKQNLLKKAEQLLEQSLRSQTVLADRFPDVEPYRVGSVVVRSSLAQVLKEQNRLDESEELIVLSVSQLKALMNSPTTGANSQNFPERMYLRVFLVIELRSLAQIYREMGRNDEAEEMTRQSNELLPERPPWRRPPPGSAPPTENQLPQEAAKSGK